MRAVRRTSLRAAAAIAVTALLGLITFGPAQAASATTYPPIEGTGSTYAAPALDAWAKAMYPANIQYFPLGSAMGRSQYSQGTPASQGTAGYGVRDFAGSDIAFLTSADPDPFDGKDGNTDFAYSYIPDVAGGLSFLYNLQVGGRKITNMRLSGKTLAEIFTGHITNWNNPAVTHDYGAQLPSIPITVVTRSDGSGESYFLTRWMWKEFPSLWTPFCVAQGGPRGCGPTEGFPGQSAGFKALNGSDVLSGYVASSSNNGAIGYAEQSYAKEYHVPVVNMLNSAGYYVAPTAGNVAIALEKAQINENQNSVDFLMQNLDQVYGDRDPRAYPLSSYSYLIVPRDKRTIGGTTYGPLPYTTPPDPKTKNPGGGVTLSTFVNNILCGDQASAADMGYSPLPKPMVVGGFLQESHIPQGVRSPAASNYKGCNNPAYQNGVDLVTKDAPYPNACQKVGSPLNCKVVNGRAVSTGSGAGGSSGSGIASGNGTGAGGTGAGGTGAGGTKAAGNGSGVKINPNTGQVESGNAPAATDVSAQPVTLASNPVTQWTLGALAAVALTAAVTLPAPLGAWLQRTRRRRGGF